MHHPLPVAVHHRRQTQIPKGDGRGSRALQGTQSNLARGRRPGVRRRDLQGRGHVRKRIVGVDVTAGGVVRAYLMRGTREKSSST